MPVETYDERLTTRMADQSAREGARADRDSLAAAHLLESLPELSRRVRRGEEASGRREGVVRRHRGQPHRSGEGDGVKPPTDEFGRDDPASLERERRRRERERAARQVARGARAQSKPAQAPEQPPSREPAERAQAPEARAASPRAGRRARRRPGAPRFAGASAGIAAEAGAPAPHLQRAQAAPDLPAPPHPGPGAGARRRAGRLVSDRLLPAAAVRPGQRIGRGDRHRAGGSERQRRRRPAHRERRGLERDPLRVAPEAGRQDRTRSCRAATSSRTT